LKKGFVFTEDLRAVACTVILLSTLLLVAI
jgi:hypothetical protein